jgi:hypothetical protein
LARVRKQVWVRGAIVFGLALALYTAAAPAVPNGDGIGYLRAARHGELSAGHPLYVPLLRALGAVTPTRARWISAVCGAAGVALVATRASLLAAAGLGVSFSYLVSASDVEVYAPATLALLGVLLLERRAARAIAGGLAIALHLEHVLLLPFLWAEAGLGACAAAAAMGAAVYGVCAFGVLRLTAPQALAWVLSSSHGFTEARWKAPFALVFGVARSLLAAPYPYEATWPRVIAQVAPGAALAGALVLAARRASAPPGLTWPRVWLIVGPYVGFGLLFFPSEAERWLFVLPLVWLSAAPRLLARPRASAGVLAGVLAWNLALGVLPQRDTAPLEQARRAHARLLPGDLVVGPGHGWDELVDLEQPMPQGSELVLLAYYAGRSGGARALASLRARAGARRVVLLRQGDADPLGWKELAQLGVTRDGVRAAFPQATALP